MKLQDIEALLNVNAKADIELYEVPMCRINEVARVFGVELDYITKLKNHFVIIKKRNVSITLNTMQKTWK